LFESLERENEKTLGGEGKKEKSYVFIERVFFFEGIERVFL